MDNKKFLLPLLLIVLCVVSLSAVAAADNSAADASSLSIANDASVDNVAASSDYAAPSADAISTYAADVKVNASTSTNDTKLIQDTINGATAGDTIDFGNNTYNGVDNVKVDKNLNIIGNGAILNGYSGDSTGSNSIFVVQDGNGTSVAGTTISGLTFVNLAKNNGTYTGINGYGIEVSAADNITVNNCTFINGSAGVYLSRATNCLVSNSVFYGASDMSTVNTGKKETGTKAVNIMGGNNNAVIGNTFAKGNGTNDVILDGVSVASNAKNVQVINNTFNSNAYGMFFGGGVENTTVTGNTFNTPYVYAVGASKSATAINVKNNTFILANNTNAVHAEQGNDAHGYPSPIGNITVTGNTVSTAEGANAATLNVLEVYGNGGALTPSGAIIVSNNTVAAGITNFTFWDKNWGSAGNINITPSETKSNYTVMTANNINITAVSGHASGENFTCTLVDQDNKAVVGAECKLTLYNILGESKEYWSTTNSEGIAKLPIFLMTSVWNIVCEFPGNNNYKAANSTSVGIVIVKA